MKKYFDYCMECNIEWECVGSNVDHLCPQCGLFSSSQRVEEAEEKKEYFCPMCQTEVVSYIKFHTGNIVDPSEIKNCPMCQVDMASYIEFHTRKRDEPKKELAKQPTLCDISIGKKLDNCTYSLTRNGAECGFVDVVYNFIQLDGVDYHGVLNGYIEDLLKYYEYRKKQEEKKMKPSANYPLGLLNCAILTGSGKRQDYVLDEISLDQAKEIIGAYQTEGKGFISAIGHQATAEVMSALLETSIPMNRIEFEQQPGQEALVFKLKSRIPEGKILTFEQIEEIGYEFKLLSRGY